MIVIWCRYHKCFIRSNSCKYFHSFRMFPLDLEVAATCQLLAKIMLKFTCN